MSEKAKQAYTPEGCNELRFNTLTMIRIIQHWLNTYTPHLNLEVTGVVYDMSSLQFMISVKGRE